MDKPWYLDPIFSNYWTHYKSCMKWIKENGQEEAEFKIDQFFEEFHEKGSQGICNFIKNIFMLFYFSLIYNIKEQVKTIQKFIIKLKKNI